MTNDGPERFKGARRQAIRMSPNSLIRTSLFNPNQMLPLVVQPNLEGISLPDWAKDNRDFIEDKLSKHGAILYRGFNIGTAADFEQVVETISGEPLKYRERSSPRRQVSGNVYTSTDYPADQTIFLHNEHSYAIAWPMKIYFFCETAPQQRGETPLADTRRIYRLIDRDILNKFATKGWMYVRNFRPGCGLSWQVAYQTDDRAKVEEYCRNAEIEFEWLEGDRLRTRQVRPALRKHPRTGEAVWFNHATFFHVSTLDIGIRDAFSNGFAQEDLPNNTYYGDGSEIEPLVLDNLRNAYLQEQIAFSWERGDLLMADNMLVAHGRNSYLGPRSIWVAMAELSHPVKR